MKNLLFGLMIPPVFALIYANYHHPKHIEVRDVILKDAVSFFENEVKPDAAKPCFNGKQQKIGAETISIYGNPH